MVTIQDIAEKLNISATTVSLVLNNRGRKLRIGTHTCALVERAAHEMGYTRNDIARSMATGKTNVIGFLVSCAATEHCARLLDGIMRTAYENDYFVKVIYAEPGCTADSITRLCIGQRLSGLIVYDCSGADKDFLFRLHSQIIKHDIPLAIAASDGNFDQGIRILADNVQGGGLIFKHLYAQGHRSFIVDGGFFNIPWAAERRGSFLSAAAAEGIIISENCFFKSEETLLINGNVLKALIKETGATAVFCLSDYTALTVLNTLQTIGISVPNDVAVAGYGNMNVSDFAVPTITTIEEHLSAIGSRVVNVVLDKIKSQRSIDTAIPYMEKMKVELIVKSSTVFKR